MTYLAAIRFLYDLQMFGAKLGLENTLALAQRAGRPQNQLRFIHVAGTNGKGSVCALLESIYRAAGLRVGLYTSPHLVAFGERIQVNRQLISPGDIARLTTEMRDWLRSFPAAGHPTFFEVVTVMALRHFAEQQCDLVIWETGLGGRLDATNIVTPLASVITNIQFDHQAWLGDTLAQIATEKAGIIKPGVPVLTAVADPEALAVLQDTARAQQAPFRLITSADAAQPPLAEVTLPLPGAHQRLNAALACATVRVLADRIPVPEPAFLAGLRHVQWPGRLQLLQRGENRLLLLDGAHNVGGAEALCATLRSEFGSPPLTLVLGILQDKNCPAICRVLAPLAARILLVPVNSRRTAAPADLAPLCRTVNPAAEIVECASLADSLARAAADPFVLITGSLYLIGEALERLGVSSPPAADESSLNEWTAKPTDHEKLNG